MYFLTHSFLLKALGSALLNSFWQMALVWLLAIVVSGSNNRFSSRTRHGVFLSMLLAGSAWTFSGLILTIVNSGSANALTSTRIWQNPTLPAGLILIQQGLSPTLPYLSLAYVLVVLFLALRHSMHHFHVVRLRNHGLHKVQPRIKLFVDTIAQRMGIRRKVNIWLSDLVDGPLTLGFYKPIILFPIAVINQLTMEQVEAILLHELAHIRRNDYVINLVISWLSIIFFFNPFARMLIREIRKEREHCCDDLVLQFQYEPHAYASALLSLEKSRFRHSGLVLAAAGRSRQLLLERVKRLSGQKITGRRFSLSAMAFLFISLTGSEFFTINPLPPKPVAETAAVAPKQDKVRIQYVSSGSFESGLQTTRKSNNTRKLSAQKNKKETHDLIWVADNQNNVEAITEATPAISADNRAFSIENSDATPAPIVSLNGMDHPYVPSTSFNYHLQVDTSTLSFIGRNDETLYALENVTLALDELNKRTEEENDALDSKSMQPFSGNYSVMADGNYPALVDVVKGKNGKVTIKLKAMNLKKASAQDKEKFIILQQTIRRNQLLIQKQQLEDELKFLKVVPVKNKRTVVYI